MKYLSVCSGIEAATVAWHPLGWTPVGFSEIEPFPCAVLAHHYPDTPNFGDMTKHEQWNIEPGTVDLLVGGTPCQSFSVAGLRQGLKDPRGNLMLTYLAIAARLRPRWIVWENVFGVLSSNGGRDFGTFLGALGELGYGFAYRVLDAQWVRTHGHPHAIAQRRRRVFVVGCAGDHISAAKVLFERESVFRNPSSRRAAGQTVAGTIAARSGESRNNPEQLVAFDQQRQGQYGDGEVASTKAARDFKDATDLIVIDRASFNQGENAAYPPHIERTNVMDPLVARGPHAIAFTQNCREEVRDLGNVAGALSANEGSHQRTFLAYTKSKRAQSATDDETWVEGVVAPTQNAFDVGDVRATTVAIPIMPQAMQSEGWRVGKETQDGRGNGLGVGKDGDPCPTLDRSAVPAVAIQGTVIGRKDHNGPQGAGHSESGEMFTLNSTDVHAVAFPINGMTIGKELRDRQMTGVGNNGDPSYTIRSAGHQHAVAVAPIGCFKSGQGAKSRSIGYSETVSPTLPSNAGGNTAPSLVQTMQVRRLTPTECERLQGFPDGWTAIPWKKKSAEDCPDGPRYKALGNSMAVNCMAWIGERISEVEAKR